MIAQVYGKDTAGYQRASGANLDRGVDIKWASSKKALSDRGGADRTRTFRDIISPRTRLETGQEGRRSSVIQPRGAAFPT